MFKVMWPDLGHSPSTCWHHTSCTSSRTLFCTARCTPQAHRWTTRARIRGRQPPLHCIPGSSPASAGCSCSRLHPKWSWSGIHTARSRRSANAVLGCRCRPANSLCWRTSPPCRHCPMACPMAFPQTMLAWVPLESSELPVLQRTHFKSAGAHRCDAARITCQQR